MADKPILVDYNFGGTAKVTGLPVPVAVSDAARKSYVDLQYTKVIARTSRLSLGY